MLEIGRYNRLKVAKMVQQGAYLASESGEILLPRKYVPEGLTTGDMVEVFIYLDSEDRLIATTIAPKAQVGQFALLQVKDTGNVGAFLDWGLEKDLLVPFNEQPIPMRVGERHVVRIYVDNSGRIAASAKIRRFLETERISLAVGEQVHLLIHEFTPLGAKVIINDRYSGLLFKSELYGDHGIGARLDGYVKAIRDDKKIDVTLRKSGYQGIEASKERILKTLAATGGFLPLSDNSTPETIAEVLKMSKKTFKRAIGSLYKDGFIVIQQDGIRLRT